MKSIPDNEDEDERCVIPKEDPWKTVKKMKKWSQVPELLSAYLVISSFSFPSSRFLAFSNSVINEWWVWRGAERQRDDDENEELINKMDFICWTVDESHDY